MLTKITIEFLATTCACGLGVEWFRDRPELRGASWKTVCAALEKDGQGNWSHWVRTTVAICGTAEDRAILRSDLSASVRRAVAICGTDEDRAALRNDPSVGVRWAVAICGTAGE